MAKKLGVSGLGMVRKKLYFAIDFTGINPQGTAAGPLAYAGSSSVPIISSTANTKFFQEYVKSTATSGDNRCRYSRLYLAGAGGGGECLRAFTTVQAACGTAHGAHLSLNFSGDTTGELSGLGVAARCTLHIPDDAAWAGGTLSALQAEIYSDGAASDPDGLTELSFIRVINGGNSTGMGDVDTDAFFISAQGLTAGSGKCFDSTINTAGAQIDHTLKIKVGSSTMYIPLMDNADGS